MSDMLTEIRFWSQVMTDSERTVYCSPENESRIKTWVNARGMGGIITVHAVPYVPDNQVLVVDRNAIEATTRQMATGSMRWDY